MNNKVWMFAFVAALLVMGGCQRKSEASENGAEAAVRSSTEITKSENSLPENHEGTALDVAAMSEAEIESVLIGDWMLFYPMPDQNWGHQFRDNHVYFYYDSSRKARQQRYRFSQGVWQVVDNEIQVKVTSYRISDRDAVEDVLGFRFPPDAQYINVPVNDGVWQTIGTLDSIRTGIVRNGNQLPPRITLLPLLFDQVQDEEEQYWRYSF